MIINKMRSIIVGATGAILLLGMSTPVVAQDVLASLDAGHTDPFEVSHRECKKTAFKWCGATTVAGTTVREFISNTESMTESVLSGNSWDESMMDEEIPVRKFFFLVANPT